VSKTGLTLVLPDYAFIFASDLNRNLVPHNLQRWLKKAQFEANHAGYYQQLLALFSALKPAADDLPIAMLRGGSSHSLCADPCYLHPDRDKLRLFYRDLALSMDEAEALCQRVQGLFAEFDASLTVQTAEQWLLELKQPAQVSFRSLEGLHGQTVTGFLPTGVQASDWIRLWNEVQMALFDCPENQAREAEGKMPINSLWFWGAGTLPDLRAWAHVSGDDRVLAKLAEDSHSQYQADVSSYEQIGADEAMHVMVFDKEQDWQMQLNRLFEDWLIPALRALRRWQLNELKIIVPEWGCYRLTPLRSWKWWA
jgi:hypothetical protein